MTNATQTIIIQQSTSLLRNTQFRFKEKHDRNTSNHHDNLRVNQKDLFNSVKFFLNIVREVEV